MWSLAQNIGNEARVFTWPEQQSNEVVENDTPENIAADLSSHSETLSSGGEKDVEPEREQASVEHNKNGNGSDSEKSQDDIDNNINGLMKSLNDPNEPTNQARDAFMKDVQENRGLMGGKMLSELGYSRGGEVLFSGFCEGENGYAATFANGANTFVISDGEGKFQTGTEGNVQPMTYDEAKAFSELVLLKCKTIDDASLQKMTTMSSTLYNLDPQAFAKDTALSQGITIDDTSKITKAESGTLIISDNGIVIASSDGHVFGCSVGEDGKVEGFRGIYGKFEKNDDARQLKFLTDLVSKSGRGDSEIGRALGEKTGVEISAKPEQTAPAHSPADHIRELGGTSQDSAMHTSATPRAQTHTGNPQPVRAVSTR